jgi:hypothetical protein
LDSNVNSQRSFGESKLGHTSWRSDRCVLILDTHIVASNRSQCQTHTRHRVLVMPEHGMLMVRANMGSWSELELGGKGFCMQVHHPQERSLHMTHGGEIIFSSSSLGGNLVLAQHTACHYGS